MERVTKIFCLLLLVVTNGFAQFKKIRSLEVSDSITFVAVDRPGDFYISMKDGQLQHFDYNGKLLSVYKNQKSPAPTLFDPRDGSRLFAYYRAKQEYAWLSPALEPTRVISVDSAFFIEPWLICSSGDYNLWILDAADWSLRKIDTKASQVIVETNLASQPASKSDLTHMREYLGYVFLLDQKKGIHIYSSMGKLIRTVPMEAARYFNFLGQELYYLSGSNLTFFDLYSTETRSVKLPVACTYALLTDERLFCFQGKTIQVFEVRK